MAANAGSTGFSPGLIGFPHLPMIVAEWAALLPLVSHLAGYQDDYNTTGKISLLGRLPMSLFPALGTFSGIARLLDNGSDYLDYASTKGGSSRKVWDVNWGSVFPVANGAASAWILSSVLRRQKSPLTRIDSPINMSALPSTSVITTQKAASAGNIRKIYRPQILNVYDFKKTDGQKCSSTRQALERPRVSAAFQVLLIAGLMGLTIFLSIFGTFGSAVIVLLCAVSIVFGKSTTIQRPAKYLDTNDVHDACMLVAAHENATEWHLCIGDLGIVDTLLNKPVIVLPEGKRAHFAAMWFRCAHVIQLMAMTFVASQKGWDGACLVILLAVHYIISWPFSPDSLANKWLEKERITINVESFEFHGRSDMIYTIQLFSESRFDCWIDDIMVPHPRRNFSLQMLKLPEGQAPQFPPEFSQRDQDKITRNVTTAKKGAQIIKEKLKQYHLHSNSTPP